MSQAHHSLPLAEDSRPVLIYDGYCGFCTEQVSRLERLVNGAVRMRSFRDPGVISRYPGLTRAQCQQALQLVEPGGRIYSGAEAIAATLQLRPLLASVGWLYYLPVVRQVADWGYRFVTRRRSDSLDDVCIHDACRQHRL
jgi:predicted DCC family thiol-disulfide oxidoreductase YuxK